MTTNVLCYIIAVAVIALVLGPGCIQSAALVLNSSKTKNVREKLLKMLARLADACWFPSMYYQCCVPRNLSCEVIWEGVEASFAWRLAVN